MMDKFVEFGCEFKNEAAFEEELDEEGLDFQIVEMKHYEEEEY